MIGEKLERHTGHPVLGSLSEYAVFCIASDTIGMLSMLLLVDRSVIVPYGCGR